MLLFGITWTRVLWHGVVKLLGITCIFCWGSLTKWTLLSLSIVFILTNWSVIYLNCPHIGFFFQVSSIECKKVMITVIYQCPSGGITLDHHVCWIWDHDGEIPKSKGRGWRFNSRLWNLLSTWCKTCQVVNCPVCFGVGMSAFCLKK